MSANTPISSPEGSSRSSIRSTSPQRGLLDPQKQRPPIRPKSALARSASSIQTLPKISENTSRNAKRNIFFTGTSSSSIDKKIHKRVLSSTSLKNDYFGTNRTPSKSPAQSPSHSDSNIRTITLGQSSPNLSPSESRAQSAVALPKFQSMSSQDRPIDDDLSSQKDPNLPQNLSSSKIYERRKSREREKSLSNVASLAEEDQITDLPIDDDENVISKKFQEKLNNMKKIDMDNSDVEMSDDSNGADDLESDSDSYSENETTPQSKPKTQSGKNESNTVIQRPAPSYEQYPSSDNNSSSTNEKNQSEEENGTEQGGFKGFLRKMAMVDELDDIPERLKRKDSQHKDNGGIFSKFINFGGSGLMPGATRDEPHKQDDEEAQNTTVAEDGIEMKNLDPEAFKQEANDILQSHVGHSHANSKTVPAQGSSASLFDGSEQTTLNESMHSGNGSFLAPNPDLYFRDESGIYEMNLDDGDSSFIAPPERVRGGVLSSLLKLYQNPEEASKSRLTLISGDNSPINSPSHEKDEFISSGDHHTSLAGKLKNFAGGNKKKVALDDANIEEQKEALKQHRKNASFGDIGDFLTSNSKKKMMANASLPSFAKSSKPNVKKLVPSGIKKSKREHTKARITVHIAEILQRQRFIIRLCKALMLYGAPTHRLEEYLTMTARVLEIDAQFIYLPGCMIISFGDATTRTSEVQLVRCAQGLDLYKLHRAHRIYKKVIHDLIGVEDASIAIDDLLSSKPIFSPMMCVLIYAFSSAMVTPFAFAGGWIDLPIAFGIGGCVGLLQFYLSPRSNLYSNVFEVAASIVVSFIGRALGSIKGSGICFSAVVQGSLALILPGYIILCGALELQSRNLVSGAVRMFYAVIYSLFLGFGLTMGSALYGWIDKNATSSTTCENPISPWYRFIFVPGFTLGLALINQAKWFQLPIMLFIACTGYVVTFFSSKYFYDSTEFTASLASFVIGVLGNLYSRIWKGLAVSAMLPGIFLQVPGGVGSQQTLLVGVENANRITHNRTLGRGTDTSGIGFGITMVQIVIGISVGLFASTIAVYPLGKKSTSVFTL